MKALLLNGAINDDLKMDLIGKEIVKKLTSAAWDVESIELRTKKIAPCNGCFHCWIKTPGICIINDDGREVTKKFIQSDLVILLTPLTLGGHSSELKKALDRSISIMLPYFTKINGKTHHKKRYKYYPKLLALGILPKPDSEAERIFKDLVKRNSYNSHAPFSSTSVILHDLEPEEVTREIATFLESAGVSE